MKNFDDTTWQWSELADACYIFSIISNNWREKGLANHTLVECSDDEQPRVIITGRLPEYDIKCFLINAIDSQYINPELSPSDLNDIAHCYSYGYDEDYGQVTYIYPTQNIWDMMEREELSDEEWAELTKDFYEMMESVECNDEWF